MLIVICWAHILRIFELFKLHNLLDCITLFKVNMELKWTFPDLQSMHVIPKKKSVVLLHIVLDSEWSNYGNKIAFNLVNKILHIEFLTAKASESIFLWLLMVERGHGITACVLWVSDLVCEHIFCPMLWQMPCCWWLTDWKGPLTLRPSWSR